MNELFSGLIREELAKVLEPLKQDLSSIRKEFKEVLIPNLRKELIEAINASKIETPSDISLISGKIDAIITLLNSYEDKSQKSMEIILNEEKILTSENLALDEAKSKPLVEIGESSTQNLLKHDFLEVQKKKSKPFIQDTQEDLAFSNTLKKYHQILKTCNENTVLQEENEEKLIITYPHQKFNKVTILPGASSSKIQTLFDYGLIQQIYPSNDLRELAGLPAPIKSAVITFQNQRGKNPIFIRMYSAIPEYFQDQLLPVYTLVKIGMFDTPNFPKFEVKPFNTEVIEAIPRKRANGILTIIDGVQKTLRGKSKPWVYHVSEFLAIIGVGRTEQKKDDLIKWYSRFLRSSFKGSPAAKNSLCRQIRNGDLTHICSNCQKWPAETEKVIDFQSLIPPSSPVDFQSLIPPSSPDDKRKRKIRIILSDKRKRKTSKVEDARHLTSHEVPKMKASSSELEIKLAN